jgi:exosortase/archaeosortase family protein
MSWIKKGALVLSAIPFAFIWNTARVAVFGIIQETTGLTIADGFWHTFTGGLVFLFALLSLFAVRTWLVEK